MRNDDQSAHESWAKSLAQARTDQGLSELELARELLLSPSQLRGIENASLQFFHGITYYHRAVQKMADRLGITLDPPIESTLAASKPAAAEDAHLTQQSNTLARRPALRNQGVVLPTQASSRGPIGFFLGLVAIIAVSAGVYLSIGEGWPLKQTEETAQTLNPGTSPNINTTVEPATTYNLDRLASRPANTVVAPTKADGVMITVVRTQTTPSALSADNEPLSQSARDSSAVTIDNNTPTVASEPTPKPELEPVAKPQPDLIEARFNDDCWVEVRYKDGKIEQKIYTNQEVLTVDAAAIERLVFGNAQAVEASRQSKPFDVMGFAGGSNVARISAANLN